MSSLWSFFNRLIGLHELIIAQLNVYGFNLPELRLINDYLSNRQQRTKINHAYSLWEKVAFAEYLKGM